jgi:hypothetical protein
MDATAVPPSLRRHESLEGRGGVSRAIKVDVRWLGFDWGNHLYYASDYFDQLHRWAIKLIETARPMWTTYLPTKSANTAAR